MAKDTTGTKVKLCGCTGNKEGNAQGAKYQDKTYGKGNRVHNIKKDGSGYSCTVCGKAVLG